VTFLLVAIVVVCFGFSDIALTVGMRRAGEARSFHPRELAAMIGRAAGSPPFLLGLGLQGVALAAYLAALSMADLSLVFPLTATSNILTTLLARPLLGETVSRRRWAGVGAVAAGCVLISLS
jgi:drug/metabolite transporter (DMT)-like permease